MSGTKLILVRINAFQAKYIAQCIEEIKQELRQENVNVKCNAVAKLTYVSVRDNLETRLFTHYGFVSPLHRFK